MAKDRLDFNATWSMAVGGMVGGGIFSVLGLVYEIAGRWAWLSFLLAGLIALAAAHSYVRLARDFGESGGAFTFLREVGRETFAGGLAWLLIGGYILTVSVYGFTFGHYLASSMGLGAWVPRASAVALILVLAGVNLRGVGDASRVEVFAVWGKLAVLAALAAIGIAHWAPDELQGSSPGGLGAALTGAASIFMAYEGFQLLTYDYDEIENPQRTLPRAALLAVASVIVIYIAVAVGAGMLVGADTLVAQKEVALAVAGRQAAGTAGMIAVTVAAALSAASAINATLFATARLARDVADDGDLPDALAHRNDQGVPDRAVLVIAGLGALLAAVGSLGALVEAASLAFLFTFGTVNVLAIRHCHGRDWIAWGGVAGTAGAMGLAIVRLAGQQPYALGGLGLFGAAAFGGRWLRSRTS